MPRGPGCLDCLGSVAGRLILEWNEHSMLARHAWTSARQRSGSQFGWRGVSGEARASGACTATCASCAGRSSARAWHSAEGARECACRECVEECGASAVVCGVRVGAGGLRRADRQRSQTRGASECVGCLSRDAGAGCWGAHGLVGRHPAICAGPMTRFPRRGCCEGERDPISLFQRSVPRGNCLSVMCRAPGEPRGGRNPVSSRYFLRAVTPGSPPTFEQFVHA